MAFAQQPSHGGYSFRTLWVPYLGHEHGQKIAVDEASRGSVDRNEHEIIQTGSGGAGATRLQQTDHLKWHVTDAESLAQRILVRKQLLAHVGSDDSNPRQRVVLLEIEERAVGDVLSAQRQPIRRNTEDRSGCAAVAVLNVDVKSVLHLGNGLDLRQLRGDCLRVLAAQRPWNRYQRGRAAGSSTARSNNDGVKGP